MMKICLGIVLSVSAAGMGQTDGRPEGPARPRVSTSSINPEEVRVLRLHPGYATSLRMPEEISSVVVGDPGNFKAEHSGAEPRLVFIKPIAKGPAESNALITTKSGHTVSLQLVSPGSTSTDETVDFIVEYRQSRTLLIEETQESTLMIADAKKLDEANPKAQRTANDGHRIEEQLRRQIQTAKPDWHGKGLLSAIGDVLEDGSKMVVPFSAFNDSNRWIELLPPQIQLDGGEAHGKRTKAEPIAILDYQMTARRMAPGERADGIVLFERPAFKESAERLFLRLSEAEKVDRPVLLPLPFVAGAEGGRR